MAAFMKPGWLQRMDDKQKKQDEERAWRENEMTPREKEKRRQKKQRKRMISFWRTLYGLLSLDALPAAELLILRMLNVEKYSVSVLNSRNGKDKSDEEWFVRESLVSDACVSINGIRLLLTHGATIPSHAHGLPMGKSNWVDSVSTWIKARQRWQEHVEYMRGSPYYTTTEWRPREHSYLPREERDMLRCLLVLGKARTPAPDDASNLVSHYPQACLELLPEELQQYIYARVCAASLCEPI